MKAKLGILWILVLAVVVVLFSSYFIVKETEQVVITRFGDPVGGAITTAGLYFKVPLIDKANYFDKTILEWDGVVEEKKPIPTRDKKNIVVDTTARWRITDPLKFLETVKTEERAQSRLDDIIDSNIRDVISNHDLIEVVRDSDRVLNVMKTEQESESFALAQGAEAVISKIQKGRNGLTREILKKSQPIIESYGIKLIDVQIKRLIYSNTVLNNVYNRMISQYEIKSQNLRSEGDRKKAEIEGEMDLEIKKIQSEAYKMAQNIRGEGDAEAARIYAESLSQGADFYHFQRSLEAYQKSIDKNAMIIMGTDSEFYRVLKSGGI